MVRNGHLPSRVILTGIGPVEAQVPKVRDRSGAGVKFNALLAPPYVRCSPWVSAALPRLDLKWISSRDLGEALWCWWGRSRPQGHSPAVVGRLKAQRGEECRDWTGRSPAGKQYVYWWAGGIYTSLRGDDDPRLCLLVIEAAVAS